jgi:uncharacterized protein YcfJ
MSNKRHTANTQLKAREDYGSRPAPGVAGTARQSLSGKTANWVKVPGPKGRGYDPHRQGFVEIRTHQKQDMPDDFSLQGMMGGAVKGGQLGSMAGPWGAAAGAVIGGVMGGFLSEEEE